MRTDSGDVVASTSDVSKGARVEVTVADGGFGARVEEVMTADRATGREPTFEQAQAELDRSSSASSADKRRSTRR